MKIFQNKKWLIASAIFCGIAFAGMAAYETYFDEEASVSAALADAKGASAQNTPSTDSMGVLDKLQAWTSWTSGWGFTPFGGGKGATDEPAPIANGLIPYDAPHFEVSIKLITEENNGRTSAIGHQCSGIAIAPQMILTAAHCVATTCAINDPATRQTQCKPVAYPASSLVITNNYGSVDLSGQNGDIAYTSFPSDYSNPAYIVDAANDLAIIFTRIPIYDKATAIGKLHLNNVSEDNKYAKIDYRMDNTKSYPVRIAGYGYNSNSRNAYGQLNEGYGNTKDFTNDDLDYILNELSWYSTRQYGITAYNFGGVYIRRILRGWNTTFFGEQALMKGDSGGGLRHEESVNRNSKNNNRYFAINSATSLDNPTFRVGALIPVYEFYTPLRIHKGWIDFASQSVGQLIRPGLDLTDGGCYPNWPETRKRSSKTGKCDNTSSSDTQSDKNSNVADNNTGLGNNSPLSQCTPADLRRMAQWNRDNSAQGQYNAAHAIWQDKFMQILADLRENESNNPNRNRGGGSSIGNNNNANIIVLTNQARQQAGREPQRSDFVGLLQIDLTDCINNIAKIHIPMSSIYEEGSSCQKKYLEWVMLGYTEGSHRRATIAERNAWELGGNYINRTSVVGNSNPNFGLFDYTTDNTIQEFASFTPECRIIDYRRLQKYLDDITPQCNYPCFKPRRDIDQFNQKIDGQFLFNIIGNWLMSFNFSSSGRVGSGNLGLINSTEGTRYSDGSVEHRFEWSTPSGTIIRTCIVPASVMRDILNPNGLGGSIGSWGFFNCRP